MSDLLDRHKGYAEAVVASGSMVTANAYVELERVSRERIAELEAALSDVYRFIDEHVYITPGDHEHPPEPGDQFSHDAGSVMAHIQTVLGQGHDYIVTRDIASDHK